ncbi:MAG: AMP-binding protein, partial [Pollutimonas bauzanensis]
MLPTAPASYEDIRERFAWSIPPRYNIGVDACAKWAEREPGRLALIHVNQDGEARNYSFGQVHEASNRLANLLAGRGVEPGDRIGILLPQDPATAIAHIASYKSGCIAIPLFSLFGAEALQYRLADSGAKVVITNGEGAAKLAGIRDRLPALAVVFSIDGAAPGVLDLHREMAACGGDFSAADTAADDPAVIIYT